MALCSSIVGIPKVCGDNNLGAIQEAYIGSFEDVTSLTVTDTADPDTDGEVTAVTREVGTQFEKFEFPKDTSMFSENWTGDLVADTHSYTQTVELGFRRFELRKRNAVMTLASGRRDLIVVAKDFNGDFWMLGSDQGLRLSAQAGRTNNTIAAGQSLTVTLTSENEKYMAYKVDATVAAGLLEAAV